MIFGYVPLVSLNLKQSLTFLLFYCCLFVFVTLVFLKSLSQ